MTEQPSSIGGGQDRRFARRFPISTPLSYRVWNETQWHHGTTENISTAGIFFRSEISAERGTQLEIGFVLPSALREGSGAWVTCTGEVIRREPSLDPGVPPALAVRIMFSQLKPWKDAPGDAFGPGSWIEHATRDSICFGFARFVMWPVWRSGRAKSGRDSL